MHKFIKQNEINSWVKLEQFILLDETHCNMKIRNEEKTGYNRCPYHDEGIDCLSVLGEFYYKTDD